MSKSCPKCGRRLDSSWTACPYCKTESQAKQASDPKGSSILGLEDYPSTDESRTEAESMTDRSSRNPTNVERDVRDPVRRETKVRPGPSASEQVAKPARGVDNRRIVGVLLSYTWLPEGKLFPVREGRTHIGSGKIKDDPEHRDVEVQCPMDQLVSADHALILVQSNVFYIQDLASTNGTHVNGKLLRPETVEDLPNEAEIKVGKTVFTFIRFKPLPATETPEPKISVEPESGSGRRTRFDWPKP